MSISPDFTIYFEWGFFKLNATILFTWLIMALLVIGSWLVTRKLTYDNSNVSRGQNILEIIVVGITGQIREATQQKPDPFLPFIGTMFLFIATSNTLGAIPGFPPPTGSLSTTAAIAICVFFAVPLFGIPSQGWKNYFKAYFYPLPILFPLNVIGDFTRILALAVRLFGNIMSGTMIGVILLSIVPLFFPVIMQVLGLLIGLIQAYIFSVLAMVYIASSMAAHSEDDDDEVKQTQSGTGMAEGTIA